VWLGHSAALHSHTTLHPHFCKPWKPAVSFIGLAKLSDCRVSGFHTAGTLCAIWPKNLSKKVKISNKFLDII
jgi:hypothetical protein